MISIINNDHLLVISLIFYYYALPFSQVRFFNKPIYIYIYTCIDLLDKVHATPGAFSY
jgi:hypothetical protein